MRAAFGRRWTPMPPHHLTIEQRETLEREMHARADRLREEIAQALRQTGRPEALSLANHIDEIDDAPVADVETALEGPVLEHDFRELRGIAAARRRLHTPEFGICVDCEADIPYTRLRANPAAIRCVSCQDRFEREHTVAPPRTPPRTV